MNYVFYSVFGIAILIIIHFIYDKFLKFINCSEINTSFIHLSRSLKSEDHADFKVFKAIQNTGRSVMHKILVWGCEKDKDESYSQYIKRKTRMTNTEWRKSFDADQRETLRVDSEGNSFDVSLLYKCIQKLCKEVHQSKDEDWKDRSESSLEFLLYSIKKFRNDFIHKQKTMTHDEVITKMNRLRYLYTKSVYAAGKLFKVANHKVQESVIQVHKDLDGILQAPLVQNDVEDYLKHILIEQLKDYMVKEGSKELISNYYALSEVNPIHFIAGNECHMDVCGVFTYMEVEEAERLTQGTPVTYRSILELCHNNKAMDAISDMMSHKTPKNTPSAKKSNASIILLEGLVGSGKTTITKLFISNWKKENNEISSLDTFNLVIYMECRNSYISSLSDLLISNMPKTAERFQPEDLVKVALQLRLLVLIDGLDELNSESEKVVNELFYKIYGRDVTVLCTSRPEKVNYFYRMVPSHIKTAHVRIIGIPESKREEFIAKYHRQLITYIDPANESSLQGLLTILSKLTRLLGNHIRLPLNLVLVTYLWIVAPEKLTTVGTATGLYIALHDLFKEKMMDRIQKKIFNVERCSVSSIDEKCKLFLQAIYNESLVSLSKDDIILSDESCQKIFSASKNICSIGEEVMSAFLVVKTMWTPKGFKKVVSMPHKGLQDFLAAQAIVAKLGKVSRSIISILNDLHKDKSSSLNLAKYQNVLYHIPGLMRYNKGLSKARARELIGLFKRAGIRDSDQWLDTLVEMEFHKIMCIQVVQHMDDLRIRDDNMDSVSQLIRNACPKSAAVSIAPNTDNSFKLAQIIEKLHECSCHTRIVFFGRASIDHQKPLLEIFHYIREVNMKVFEIYIGVFIDLLRKTGYGKNDEWLSILKESKYNRIVCENISRLLPCINISDENIKEMIKFISVDVPKKVNIFFSSKTANLFLFLNVLDILAGKDCKVMFQYDSGDHEECYKNLVLLVNIMKNRSTILKNYAEQFTQLINSINQMNCNELLDVASQFHCHQSIIHHLRTYMTFEKWKLKDDSILPALSFLEYDTPKKVILIISRKFENIGLLPNLLHKLTSNNCNVKFALEQHDEDSAFEFTPILFEMVILMSLTHKKIFKNYVNQVKQWIKQICCKDLIAWLTYAEDIFCFNVKNKIKVKDEQLEVLSVLLKYGCPKRFQFSLFQNAIVSPVITKILEQLSKKTCEVELQFHYLFKNPSELPNCEKFRISLHSVFSSEM